MPPPTPTWLRRTLILALTATAGLFVAAWGVAARMWTDEDAPPPLLYVRTLSAAMIALGVTLGLSLLHTARVGEVYSGLARGIVTRRARPLHFWTLLGLVALIPLALIAWGLYKFLQ